MFENRIILKKMKERGNIKTLCRAVKHRNEKIWTSAVDSLIELDGQVKWERLFPKIPQEKQNYCINILIHRLVILEYREKSLSIIKQIGEAAMPAVLDIFYQHVNTIRTTGDFEKLQSWLKELISIIGYCKPSESVKVLIEIYERSLNQDIRYMVLEHLGQLREERALKFIREQLSDVLIYTRIAAIKALGLTHDSRVVPVILEELQNNTNNSLYVKKCLEALISIGNIDSVQILASYLHKGVERILKEKIAESLLSSPYIEMKDVEAWFGSNVPYEIHEILVKAIVIGEHRDRISEYIIKCVTQFCLAFYGKGNDMYTWGVRLLEIKKKDALYYLVSLLLEKEYNDLSALDTLIGEFKGDAFPYLKAVYPLADTWESRGRIIKLMAVGEKETIAGVLIQNIRDIFSLISLYIRQRDEEKIIELIEIMGKNLKGYFSVQEALEPIMALLLSKCRGADYSDEERFLIKILYHFYKYFYFKELEEFFITYIDRSYIFWRYAFKALEYHETDRSTKVLEQYMLENRHNDEEVIDRNM